MFFYYYTFYCIRKEAELLQNFYLLLPIRSSISQMTEAGNNCLFKIYLWFENNVSKLTKLKKSKM